MRSNEAVNHQRVLQRVFWRRILILASTDEYCPTCNDHSLIILSPRISPGENHGREYSKKKVTRTGYQSRPRKGTAHVFVTSGSQDSQEEVDSDHKRSPIKPCTDGPDLRIAKASHEYSWERGFPPPPDPKDFLLNHSCQGIEKHGALEQYHEPIKDNIEPCINGLDYKRLRKPWYKRTTWLGNRMRQ